MSINGSSFGRAPGRAENTIRFWDGRVAAETPASVEPNPEFPKKTDNLVGVRSSAAKLPTEHRPAPGRSPLRPPLAGTIVARLAALWPTVVARSGEVVAHLGEIDPSKKRERPKVRGSRPPRALSLLFKYADIVILNRRSSTKRSADPTAGDWVSPARAALGTPDSPSRVPRSPFFWSATPGPLLRSFGTCVGRCDRGANGPVDS